MSDKKCVLAYSGGLDTSAIVVWLKERGYDIHAVLVDVGQQEDIASLKGKAIRLGATSAEVVDAKPAMIYGAAKYAISLAATYEGNYRLGTALARPYIAAAQVKKALQVGGATLVHGATGKGNDQIRFEYAYRSLAPHCPVLAPWKCWDLRGRQDMVDYLTERGYADAYEVNKEFSLDENLWHLSVEGGPLENGAGLLDVTKVLSHVADRFGTQTNGKAADSVSVTFSAGVPVAIDGKAMELGEIINVLNSRYRHAAWGWDLVLENRATGIKSRGVYINPAAKLLQMAVDGLARAVLNKPMYDRWVELGREYGQILYKGEYFSDQRVVVEAAADAVLQRFDGTVTVQLSPVQYVSRIESPQSMFSQDLATFEASQYDHKDAAGFIHLSWLASVGRPFIEESHADLVEAGQPVAPGVRALQQHADAGLVPASV